ncbi:hypothetical protein NC653_012659 [Populus alba x Populus x berolinensis]|uniref:Uncharacterized protein n=1 Tax=Populus alba x Populus x berolinensis TaxID=444605 RepID=A0AAD6W1Q2_9ROSI|nr:hypothetical protein NC653_012659 [Populus alba x Populus x berolinensis]
MSFASIRFASFSPSSSLPYVFSLFLHSLSFFYALLSCLPPVVLLTVTYPLSFFLLSFLPLVQYILWLLEPQDARVFLCRDEVTDGEILVVEHGPLITAFAAATVSPPAAM